MRWEIAGTSQERWGRSWEKHRLLQKREKFRKQEWAWQAGYKQLQEEVARRNMAYKGRKVGVETGR